MSSLLRTAFILLALILLAPTVDAATLIYENGFEDGNTSELKWHGGCYDYSYDWNTPPFRAGSNAIRVENRGLENNLNCSGVFQKPNHRALVSFQDKAVNDLLNSPATRYGVGFWTGFSIYVPTSWPTIDKPGPIMWQWNGGFGGPELYAHLRRGGQYWSIMVAYDDLNGNAAYQDEKARIQPVRGGWNDFVIYRVRALEGDGNTGRTKIWLNGDLVFDYTGPNARNYQARHPTEKPLLFFDLGIYWADDYNIGVTFIANFDSVRIAAGNDSDGYSLVDPAQGGTPTPTPTEPGVCNTYGPQNAVPTGYGASYNVFKTSEMMVSVYCKGDNSIKVTTGNGDPLTYIYKEGYYYKPSTKSWTNFTYSCDNMIANAWCVGEVEKNLSVPTTGTNFLVSFTCQWSGSKWNCGCSNTSCSSHNWQLQGYGL